MNNQKLVDNITLEYLLNPLLYDKIMSKKISSEEIFNNEILFYRKRISKLTKDMCKGTYINDSLKNIFIGYASSLIYYLKQLDEKDIIQEEYIDVTNDAANDASNVSAEHVANDINNSGNEAINVANLTTSFVKKSNNTNLNNFVKKIKIESQPKILPQQKIINIKDPKLKKKGKHKISS
jgi:hypothetical protein